MVLVWLCVVGLGFDTRMAFVGGALTPGGHALPIDGIQLDIGEVSDLLVQFVVQPGPGGRHHRLQACEEAVPQSELGDCGLQVLQHSAFEASSEPSLSRQLLEHVDQDLSLALREATTTL